MFIEAVRKGFMYDERTPLSRVSPAVKMAYTLLMILLSLLASSITCLMLVLVANVVLVLAYKLGSRAGSLLLGLLPFIVLILVVNTLFAIIFGEVEKIGLQGLLMNYLMMLLRVTVVLIAMTLFVATTTPQQIVYVLSGTLGLSYKYVYPIVVAYRFIPVLFAEMQSIYDAQRARGVQIEGGGLLKRVKSLSTVIVPSVICSIMRAKDLAEAMESRGFGAFRKRTFYLPQTGTTRKHDVVLLATLVLCIIVLVLNKWFLHMIL